VGDRVGLGLGSTCRRGVANTGVVGIGSIEGTLGGGVEDGASVPLFGVVVGGSGGNDCGGSGGSDFDGALVGKSASAGEFCCGNESLSEASLGEEIGGSGGNDFDGALEGKTGLPSTDCGGAKMTVHCK